MNALLRPQMIAGRVAGKTVFAGFVLLALLGTLAACNNSRHLTSPAETETNTAGTTAADQLATDQVASNEQSAAEELASNISSSSRILAPKVDGGIGVSFVDSELKQTDTTSGGLFNRVVIQTGAESVKYKLSRFHAPERLVIDISDHPTRVGRIFDTHESAYVEKVRVGSHPDKTRVVLDLRSSKEVVYDARTSGGDLVVTLAAENLLAQALAFDYQAGLVGQDLKASPKLGDESLNSDLVRDSQAADVTDQAGEHPEDAAPPAIDSSTEGEDAEKHADENAANINVEDLKPRLVGLSLEPLGQGVNTLVADVTSAGVFSLQKTAPSEYVLRIENADLDNTAANPLLAPRGSGDIRSARAVTSGNDVLLRIFALPHTELKATARSGKILIGSNLDAYDAAFSDSMAQASPEALAAGTEKKEGDKKEGTEAKPDAAGDAAKDATAKDASAEGGKDEFKSLLGEDTYSGRLISLDLQDTDIDNALRIIAEVSNLNIIASDEVTGKVTLRLIDVPWDQALDVILRTNGLDKVQEGNVIRIAPVEKLRQEREQLKLSRDAEDALETVKVQYIRISYAKAADMKPLIEGVVTERGAVSYDDRTNQIIVKDIDRGRANVFELVKKLDLRTPQVLLETQIVEANRKLLRELGSDLGFTYIQSPATGNATGNNFPNSVVSHGSTDFGVSDLASVGFLFGSADGTKSLSTVFTALETEGRVRVVSRPAVATTNNKQAIIKSVEKIRVKTPDGGVSVATGQGANASGTNAVATEVIEIGIVLEVTPQASPDYFVLLDINAKSSTLGTTQVDGIPSEIERSATSTVLVSSGQSFAMGGIYKITDNDGMQGVPFLKDVPFLGYLFRSQTVDNADEELLFFITPRIVEGSFDDAAMKPVA